MSKRVKATIYGLVIGAVLLALGIIVLNNANAFLKIVMVVAGVASMVDGIYTLLGVNKWKYTNATKTLTTIKGVESTLIGFAAIAMGIFAADTAFTIMVYILAIGLVFSAIVSFQNAAVSGSFDIKDMRSHFLLEGTLQIVVAIILFFKPVETLELIVRIISIAFIILGALSIVFALIVMFSKSKKTSETTAEVGEAEVVEENK